MSKGWVHYLPLKEKVIIKVIIKHKELITYKKDYLILILS